MLLKAILLGKLRIFKKQKTLDFASHHCQLRERNALIINSLGNESKWILDVGSNQGVTASALSRKGHFCLGLEMSKEEYKLSVRTADSRSAFMNMPVTAEIVEMMPKWDAVLLLSVLHRIYSLKGEEEMYQLLRAIGKKSNILFIEGSIRHARYIDHGEPPPNFIDLDVTSADSWHRKILWGSLGKEWIFVKATKFKCSKKEPYRLFYQLQKHTDQDEFNV